MGFDIPEGSIVLNFFKLPLSSAEDDARLRSLIYAICGIELEPEDLVPSGLFAYTEREQRLCEVGRLHHEDFTSPPIFPFAVELDVAGDGWEWVEGILLNLIELRQDYEFVVSPDTDWGDDKTGGSLASFVSRQLAGMDAIFSAKLFDVVVPLNASFHLSIGVDTNALLDAMVSIGLPCERWDICGESLDGLLAALFSGIGEDVGATEFLMSGGEVFLPDILNESAYLYSHYHAVKPGASLHAAYYEMPVDEWCAFRNGVNRALQGFLFSVEELCGTSDFVSVNFSCCMDSAFPPHKRGDVATSSEGPVMVEQDWATSSSH